MTTLVRVFTIMTVLCFASSEDVPEQIKDLEREETKEADKNQTSDVGMAELNFFLSSTPYIKAIGYNSITQLYKIKDYGKKLGLSGQKLFEVLQTDYAKPHGSFLKRCKRTDDIFSDEKLPIPKEFDCCPFPNIKCRQTDMTYRSIDGSCNCKKSPHMGRSNRAYSRYLHPDYEGGISKPRASKSGEPLPSARLLSSAIFKAHRTGVKSQFLTVMHMTLGQFLDHDTDRTPISKFQTTTGKLVSISCGKSHCETDGPLRRDCFPIIVPENERSFLNKSCMEFVRSQAYMADGCQIGPREQPNVVTSWIDCSFLYGSSIQELRKVRDKNKSRGRMAESKHPFNDKCKPLAPNQVDTGCKNLTGSMKCFLTGDARQNEQVGISAMHIIFIRLHNYFEGELHKVNPHWDGERLFQETRKLVIAVWQNIVFNEYIPPILGQKLTSKYRLRLRGGCSKDYNCMDYTGDVSNVFATAAFRFGHSQITEDILLKASAGKAMEEIPFQSVLFRPHTIYKTHFNQTTCGVDAVLLGHAHQKTDQSDEFFSDSMRNHLFSPTPPYAVGTDLAAIDIQRGRDHGLPGYNAWRKWCDLPEAKDFKDLVDIPKHLRGIFENVYKHVDDIDVFVGGMVETHVRGGIVGNTFACIIGKQFHDLKKADRFWFERCNIDSGYQLKQINNIKSYTSGRLLCDTLDHVTSIQRYTMMKARGAAEQKFKNDRKTQKDVLELYHGHNNRVLSCTRHPGINFNLFKEYV